VFKISLVAVAGMPPKKIVPKKEAASKAAPKAKGGAKKGSKDPPAKDTEASSSTAQAGPKDEVEIDGLLDELFKLYDKDEDELIERVELLEGEETRLDKLAFGPKERKACIQWFKDAGCEGNPTDGMFLSKDKWLPAMKKKIEEGLVADLEERQERQTAKQAQAKAAKEEAAPPEEDAKEEGSKEEASKEEASKEEGSKEDEPLVMKTASVWLKEHYGKLWPVAKAEDAVEVGEDGAPVPRQPPTYPLTIDFKDLLEKLAEARAFNKQALVLAGGKDEVETFMNYRNYQTMDVKMYVSKVWATKTMSLEEAQEDAKKQLTVAMNSSGFCKPLHVRMNNAAPDWSKICCEGFPEEVFDGEAWTIEHAHKLGFFDESHKGLLEVDPKKWNEFHVVLTSKFDEESAKEFLASKIPHYDKLAILVIDPKSFG